MSIQKEMAELCQGVRCAFHGARFDLKSEPEMHSIIYKRISWVIHECDLGGVGRVDFFDALSGVVIEVKAYGSTSSMGVIRQLHKYASHKLVNGVILVSVREIQGLPNELYKKPVEQIALWSSQL